VKQETSQYLGHFGVFFRVTTFTVMPSERWNLRTLHFCAARGESWKVSNFVSDLYDRMLAQERPCEMLVAISSPLTRKQAELFNDQNDALTTAITAVAAAAVPSSNKWIRATSGFLGGASAFFGLDSRHAGDVVVSVQAWVSGGIGPQHSSAAMLIKNQGGSR
jgi:hypothetical protein